jgi:hypothetical protein
MLDLSVRYLRSVYFVSVQAALSHLPVPLTVMFIGRPSAIPALTTVNLLDSGLNASMVTVLLDLLPGESHSILASNLLREELTTVILQLLSAFAEGVQLEQVFLLDAVLTGGGLAAGYIAGLLQGRLDFGALLGREGEHPMMKLKAFGIGAALAAVGIDRLCGFRTAAAAAPAKPAHCPAEGFSGGFSRGCPQKQFANPADISAMMAALPDKPYATPQSLRHVLVLGRAVGWVHTSIPLAAKMVEYLGDKTGAWMTTITYDAAAITPENLKQYDAIFLASTTGEFLDDPNDKAATDLRRQALLTLSKAARAWPASTPLPTATIPMALRRPAHGPSSTK